MAHSPAPWQDAWESEYLDAIRRVIASHEDVSQYALRLEILSRGFPAYWQGLKKGRERALFGLHCAQIRWYVESLMDANLPSGEERQVLRGQYKALWDYAADSLMMQFPFLDPNAVCAAEADRLAECDRRIEAPLLPIYLHPLSDAQLDQIKSRWHDLRYARVDLWRELGGEKMGQTEILASGPQEPKPLTSHPHYVLTQRTLNQLQPHIWAVVAPGPDYYRAAVANRVNAEKRRLQSRSQTSREERRLERQYSRQVFQAEQIAFLLAALLESPQCFDESAAVESREQVPLEQKDVGEGENAHE